MPRLTVYDIPSGARSYITKDIDNRSVPAIYGNRIVWSAKYNESNHDSNVYIRDISTSTQTQIGDGSRPDIYDTKVVYHSDSEDPEVDMNIRMYDINTKKKITVNSSGDPEDPHIWGTKIIWADWYNLMGYIAMYDTSTGKTIDVTHEADVDANGNQYGASTGTHIAIQGDKIVYNKISTDPEGSAGVYVYNITSGKSTLLYNYPPGTYTTPDVYGDIVVWGFDTNYGYSTNNIGTYLCNLETQSETRITSPENDTENKGLHIPSTPSFEIYSGIASLFAVLLYKKK
ncbi:hypothetical protein [Methanosarcina sp. UBA289]|uniref:hypothetical protein n=1 Tax=Methanosarcina sp. UBA289 TaxID=1915574 RepID=UPI0025E8F5E0|nr:hypothetical protein [Methanosarcina sp. UBA289]